MSGDEPAKERGVPGPPEPALHRAASDGDLAELTRLIAAGEDVNGRRHLVAVEGATPLMCAGNLAVVRALLEAGADARAIDEADSDVFDHVLDNLSNDDATDDPLAVLRLLIESGADLERRDSTGWTRLYCAAFRRDLRAFDWLLTLGADPHADQGQTGGTPLHAVCWQSDGDAGANRATEEIIRRLVALGVPVDASDANGNTPLLESVSGDGANLTALRLLCDLGADVNHANEQGVTALMLAASTFGSPQCVEELLRRGADPSRVDGSNQRAVDYAREHRDVWREIVRSPPDLDLPVPLPQEFTDAKLREAEQCLQLLEDSTGEIDSYAGLGTRIWKWIKGSIAE